MDKGIIVVNMPDCCDICRFSSQAYGMEQFEEGECYCTIEMKSVDRMPEGTKPDWCPIRPIPEKKEIRGITFSSGYAEWNLNGQDRGWNDCIDELLKDGG